MEILQFGATSGSGEAAYVFVGNGIADAVYEGVIDGATGVGLDVAVTVTVGIGVATPQAANRNVLRVKARNFHGRFNSFINMSISNSNPYDNWLKLYF